jgi:hypothetical protein
MEASFRLLQIWDKGASRRSRVRVLCGRRHSRIRNRRDVLLYFSFLEKKELFTMVIVLTPVQQSSILFKILQFTYDHQVRLIGLQQWSCDNAFKKDCCRTCLYSCSDVPCTLTRSSFSSHVALGVAVKRVATPLSSTGRFSKWIIGSFG